MNYQKINSIVCYALIKDGVTAIYKHSNRTPHVMRFLVNDKFKGEFNSLIVLTSGLSLSKGEINDDDPNEITSYTYLTKLYEIINSLN